MNEVSIIINGVRYDAVETEYPCSCKGCVFATKFNLCEMTDLCRYKGADYIFKKSTKSFER